MPRFGRRCARIPTIATKKRRMRSGSFSIRRCTHLACMHTLSISSPQAPSPWSTPTGAARSPIMVPANGWSIPCWTCADGDSGSAAWSAHLSRPSWICWPTMQSKRRSLCRPCEDRRTGTAYPALVQLSRSGGQCGHGSCAVRRNQSLRLQRPGRYPASGISTRSVHGAGPFGPGVQAPANPSPSARLSLRRSASRIHPKTRLTAPSSVIQYRR